LSKTAEADHALYVFEIHSDGTSSIRTQVQIAEPLVAAWASAPNPDEQQIVFASFSGNTVQISSLSSFWKGQTTALRGLRVEDADGFLAGDLRAGLDGIVRLGLVLLQGTAWQRLALAGTGAVVSRDTESETLHPPTGAEIVDTRVDENAGLHVLYRQRSALCYVPPHGTSPAWTDDRLGSRGLDPRLWVQRGRRSVIVYDLDRGPRIEEL
jgi:hypothetical protein